MHNLESVELTNMCMISDENGRVLVQNKKNPNFRGLTFPGGHVEPGESLVDAVVREVREETGLTVLDPRLCGVKDWMNGERERYILFYFRATKFTGELRSSDEGEMRWMTLDEMLAGDFAPRMDKTVELMLSDDLSEFFFERDGDDWIPVIK